MACAEKSALITRFYKKLCEFDYRGEDLRNIIMQRQKKGAALWEKYKSHPRGKI